MLDNLNKYKIILASGSPRRRELLEGLGLHFTVKCIDGIDESYPESLPAEETALFIAKKKSEAYKGLTDSGHLIITADTVVVCNDMVLGKPSNKNEPTKKPNPSKTNKPKTKRSEQNRNPKTTNTNSSQCLMTTTTRTRRNHQSGCGCPRTRRDER